MIALFLYGSSYATPETGIIPLDKNIKQGKLANGFTYYIRKNSTPEKRVVMYLVNKVGSMQETDAQQGLAHFLEHMAFNGTKHFPKNSLVDYLQKSGVRFGADLNAYTSFDETVFQLPIASDDKKILGNAFQVMRDWAGDISLDSAEIDKERGVILSEKRQSESESQKLKLLLLPMQVNYTRYADRLPIGTEQVLKGFKHIEIKSFYKNWYRPNLQALIVVGDIDVQETEATIKKLFGDLKNPAGALPKKSVKVPLLNRNQFKTLIDPEAGNTSLQFTVKLEGKQLQTEEDYRINVARTLVSIMTAARLAELSQQTDAPFLNASYSIEKAIANLDAVNSSVTVKPGGLEQGVKAWWTALERIKQFGFTGAELQRAGTNYLSRLEATYKEMDKIPSASYVREYVNLFLHNEASPGIAYEYELTKKVLAVMDTATVNRLFKEVLTPLNREIVLVANNKNKEELPDEAHLLQWLNNDKSKLTAYTEKVIGKDRLLTTLPTPGKINTETHDKENGITTIEFANGLKVLLKPTQFSNDQILIGASSEGGFSLVSDKDFYNATIAANLVASSGLGGMNMQDLRKWMNGKRVSVTPYIGEMSEGLNGQSSNEDLETALQMIYLYFTQPQKDAQAFQRFREQAHLGYTNSAQIPGAVLQDTLASIFSNGSFRKIKMPEAYIDSLDIDKAQSIFKERFANAGDFTFLFVGNFNVDSIKPLLTQYLGSLSYTGAKETFKDLGFRVPTGNISRTLRKGKDAKANVQLFYTGFFNYSADTVALMRALASNLQTKLMENLREEKGGVYTVQANVGVQKYPVGSYNFTVRFICDTSKVDLLIDAVNAEIELMKKQGPGKEDIEKYKAVELKSLDKNMQEDGFWMQYISSTLQQKETMNTKAIYNRINQVTTEGVKATAIKYLNSSNYVRVVLLPDVKE